MGTLLTQRVRDIAAADPDLMSLSGQTLVGVELAAKLGIPDQK
jgi:hypothetical protein